MEKVLICIRRTNIIHFLQTGSYNNKLWQGYFL